MRVSDLLRRSGKKVVTCSVNNTIRDAAFFIIDNKVGALPVIDGSGGALVGIFSERDIAKAVAYRGEIAMEQSISEVMTRKVIVIGPDETVKNAMRIMGNETIRHLPVVEGGKLLGVISQRDVLKAALEDTQLELSVLRDVARTKI